MAETSQTHGTGGIEPEHDEHHAHAVSFRLLFAVFAALLVLTWATVAVAQLDFGRYDLLVAMVIAVAKGALVVTVFMHLWWDSRFNAVALVGALAFVALLIGTSSLDVGEYKPQVDAYRITNPPQPVESLSGAAAGSGGEAAQQPSADGQSGAAEGSGEAGGSSATEQGGEQEQGGDQQ